MSSSPSVVRYGAIGYEVEMMARRTPNAPYTLQPSTCKPSTCKPSTCKPSTYQL
ncbi:MULTISPECIES: hypothetical protein [unclassified Moorena]|uniref:hypothetical protein n=1 Tax=unclassified Moorena TaxID=2683338 RepID=UPI0013BC5094|nr:MULTISPECIES: hypothetical protein [unclassified Moorena]NEP32675.1 hypothetical protein [Moorena sp. SIO3B2]NER92204.1 hypothetical protein [Moorena sp. SIO3A2]NES42066.1 hypothetical protein [Moorena sp. SIO2C4]